MADKLTQHRNMPVKSEGVGLTRRCLELILTCKSPGRVVLGFRTDPDRQGESGESKDVVCSLPLGDPRARTVCNGQVASIARKPHNSTANSITVQRDLGSCPPQAKGC